MVDQAAKEPIVAVAEWVVALLESSNPISNAEGSIDGVLVSSWEESLSVPLLKEFIDFLSSFGLLVYLETAAPKFLSDPSLVEVDQITGIVIRNGTICGNGEERDAFQMAEMRPTIKAFVSQACLRSFVVLVWETLDEDATPLNAVIKRSYTWSKFYNALPWIGTKSALTVAENSLKQKEPFGAFDWLKELKVMKLHSSWRSNIAVSFG